MSRSSSICPSCGAPLSSGRCNCAGAESLDDATQPVDIAFVPAETKVENFTRKAKDALDDETAAFDSPDAAKTSAAAENLPNKGVILERVKEADRALQGLERRLLGVVDGFTTLGQLAPLVGVNMLRAQHLARHLIAAGYARASGSLGDMFELQSLKDLPKANPGDGFDIEGLDDLDNE